MVLFDYFQMSMNSIVLITSICILLGIAVAYFISKTQGILIYMIAIAIGLGPYLSLINEFTKSQRYPDIFAQQFGWIGGMTLIAGTIAAYQIRNKGFIKALISIPISLIALTLCMVVFGIEYNLITGRSVFSVIFGIFIIYTAYKLIRQRAPGT